MAAKYLPSFPKPVLDDLVTGKWLPVVGAGMSMNAVLPKGKKMPLWRELGEALASQLQDFTPSSVLDGISAYEHEFGRARLVKKLIEILNIQDSRPGMAHREFCTIPFDLVCTTNFDFLLERQYEQASRYVHPLIDEEQLSVDIGAAGTLLLKLHGDVHHPSRLVVTESDYDGFLNNYPLLATYLANQLITKTAVFIGYSLDDPDFRQIWHVVSNRLGKNRRPAYTIAINARSSDVARFERRGVKVINLPGNKERYGDILSETFRELRAYVREKVISVSKVTEEQPLRELMLPRTSTSRLCFFSLPLDLLPFYRERVFPGVEEAGFVPVTADDIVTPGDNVTAKLDSLIDRASVMVIELNSSWTRVEYGMALERLKDPGSRGPKSFQLILVGAEAEAFPTPLESIIRLTRPNLLSGDPEEFIQGLFEVLRSIANERGFDQESEPQRLFAAREYRAAVISAMTLFESRLRATLGKSQIVSSGRYLSLRALMDLAVKAEILNVGLITPVYGWLKIRNAAVHSALPIGRGEANEVMTGVLRLIQLLPA
ncbi:MAG: SIR2 family protein [Acidobacteriaceae bacterium]|nr:SIR2 family protein [Acidobacteriaceae bacterium]